MTCNFPYCQREAVKGVYCYDHTRLMGTEKVKTEKTAIKKVSDKRKDKDKEYSKLKRQYLKSQPFCELKFNVCTKVAVDIHHTAMGKDREANYLNTDTWKATCRECHRYGHDNLSIHEAKELGFKI